MTMLNFDMKKENMNGKFEELEITEKTIKKSQESVIKL